jgi:hypothetical protein
VPRLRRPRKGRARSAGSTPLLVPGEISYTAKEATLLFAVVIGTAADGPDSGPIHGATPRPVGAEEHLPTSIRVEGHL